MSMRNAWSWFKSRFEPQPDLQFETWLWWAGQQVMTQLSERRAQFRLDEALASIQADPKYGPFVADRSYRLFLKKAWADLQVTDKEKKTLEWIAAALGMPQQEARDIDLYTAKQVFGAALKKALVDGHLDGSEIERLISIASNVNLSLRDMTRAFLSEDGRVMLDEIAALAATDGGISDDQWKSILRTAGQLGLSEGDFLESIRPQSERLVEDAVSRAAADGELTAAEAACLKSLANRLNFDATARERIDRATRRLTTVKTLRDANIHELAHALNARADDAVIEFNAGAPETADVNNHTMKSLRLAGWWEIEDAKSANSKYHGGAGQLIQRRKAHVSKSLPRGFRTDSGYCNLAIADGAFCFLQNGVLLMRNGCASGVDFQDLECAKAQFISNDPPGPGATVVGHTWQYVNKSGGPDSRFRENPEIPVYLTAQIVYPRHSLSLQASDARVADQIASMKYHVRSD